MFHGRPHGHVLEDDLSAESAAQHSGYFGFPRPEKPSFIAAVVPIVALTSHARHNLQVKLPPERRRGSEGSKQSDGTVERSCGLHRLGPRAPGSISRPT